MRTTEVMGAERLRDRRNLQVLGASACPAQVTPFLLRGNGGLHPRARPADRGPTTGSVLSGLGAGALWLEAFWEMSPFSAVAAPMDRHSR